MNDTSKKVGAAIAKKGRSSPVSIKAAKRLSRHRSFPKPLRRIGKNPLVRRSYSEYSMRMRPYYLSEGTVDDILDNVRKQFARLKTADRGKDAMRISLYFTPLDARSRRVFYRSKTRFLKKRDKDGNKIGVKRSRYELEQAVITTGYSMRRDFDYLMSDLRRRIFEFLRDTKMLYSSFGEDTTGREYVSKKVLFTFTQASGMQGK